MSTPPPTNDQIEALVWRLAGYDLGPAGPRALADEPFDDTTFARLLAQATHHRIPGLLLAAVVEGALPVNDQQRSAVADTHRASCVRVLGLERRLLVIAASLEDAGIRPLVLKGSAHAHLLEPDPAMRHFADIDLLVRSDELDRAVEVLTTDRDARREVAQLRRGFDRRFAKGVTLLDDGVEVDLHRTLLFGTFAFTIDAARLHADPTPFALGDRTLYALAPAPRLLHACLHAGLGDARPRASSLRDLGRLLIAAEVDHAEVAHLARQWRCTGVLARGVMLARTHLGVEPPPPIADAVAAWQPTRAEARAIASYVGANHSHAAKVRASLPFLPDIRARAAFVAASLLPSRGFRAEQRTGALGWVRRGVRSLRR